MWICAILISTPPWLMIKSVPAKSMPPCAEFPSMMLIFHGKVSIGRKFSKNHPIVKEGVTRSGFSHPWIDLHHLKEETFILLAKTQWPGAAAETIFKQINFTPQKITRITDIQTAAQLTSVGVGATILIDKYHTFMVNPEQISILSCGEEPVYHHSGIVWKKDRILPSYCGDLFREIELSFKHIAGET